LGTVSFKVWEPAVPCHGNLWFPRWEPSVPTFSIWGLCRCNFVSYLICMFQDSVPAGSYNDPFLSSVCVFVWIYFSKSTCQRWKFIMKQLLFWLQKPENALNSAFECITHVLSPAVQLEKQTCQDMPRHVGDHLNHSCHVGCSTAWKTNMPGHCGKPSESVMKCDLQMRLDNKDAKTYRATTWFKTELLMLHCAALETDTAFPLSQNKIKLILTWWTRMKHLILIRHLSPCRMHQKTDPDRSAKVTKPTSSAPMITSHHIGAGLPVITTASS